MIDKEKLLEWLKSRKIESAANGWGSYIGYAITIQNIESGAFDTKMNVPED